MKKLLSVAILVSIAATLLPFLLVSGGVEVTAVPQETAQITVQPLETPLATPQVTTEVLPTLTDNEIEVSVFKNY